MAGLDKLVHGCGELLGDSVGLLLRQQTVLDGLVGVLANRILEHVL
jgi:hypothetical protein